MLEAVCRECDIAPDRHHTNVEWFGNTAAAGAPSVVSMRWDEWTDDRRRRRGRGRRGVHVVEPSPALRARMTYAEFQRRASVRAGRSPRVRAGWLVTDPPPAFAARLPLPPMLMLDRVVSLACDGGRRGSAVAERQVTPDDWYFGCHFAGDPVQPGCLELDGVWQLLGFWCAWAGGPRCGARPRVR